MTDSDKRPLIVTNSQIGVIGDHATIYGGIHFYQHLTPQRVDEATLAAARERLAALPVERLPDPGALPPGSRMGFRRNPLFVGREVDLLRLAATLKGGGVAAIGQIAAATGLGGIGKTQLAVEFAHRYGQFFAGGVFWLSFADPQGVPAEIAACGGPGALDLRPDFGNLPLEDQVRLVLSAWCGPLPRLLIFDNCEDEDLLARWLPPGGGARVLATSRRGQWNAELGVTALRLDVLPRAESVALLRKHRPDMSDADADAIAEELGDLPLALHVAGSFLATYRHTAFGAPQAYLTDLRREGLAHPSLADEGETLTTAHARHVGRTFDLSYQRLNPEDPTDTVALALLARSACFAPNIPIPHELLLATLILEPVQMQNLQFRIAEDGLRRLVNLGLLNLDSEKHPILHRLLADFVCNIVVDTTAQVSVEKTLWAISGRLNRASYLAPLLACQQHLRYVTDVAQVREHERAAGLCNEMGCYLDMIGNYSEAQLYYERALVIHEHIFGKIHPATATSLNNLGGLLQTRGDLVGARTCLKRALEIFDKTLGREHPATANSFNALGGVLRRMGDLDGAQCCFEQALLIFRKTLGINHPESAAPLGNLGDLLRVLGDLESSRPYLEQTAEIYELTLGPDHPATATSLSNLGLLLQAQGDLAGARLHFERALVIREAKLGPDHPDTQQARQSLTAIEAHLQASNPDLVTED